jgi:hypothetical protein
VPATETAERVEVDVDLDAVLPCEGIRYRSSEYDNSAVWNTPCENPGEWTRVGHCTRDAVYCTPCKVQLTKWAGHGWVRCRECTKVIWPDELNWRRV